MFFQQRSLLLARLRACVVCASSVNTIPTVNTWAVEFLFHTNSFALHSASTEESTRYEAICGSLYLVHDPIQSPWCRRWRLFERYFREGQAEWSLQINKSMLLLETVKDQTMCPWAGERATRASPVTMRTGKSEMQKSRYWGATRPLLFEGQHGPHRKMRTGWAARLWTCGMLKTCEHAGAGNVSVKMLGGDIIITGQWLRCCVLPPQKGADQPAPFYSRASKHATVATVAWKNDSAVNMPILVNQSEPVFLYAGGHESGFCLNDWARKIPGSGWLQAGNEPLVSAGQRIPAPSGQLTPTID